MRSGSGLYDILASFVVEISFQLVHGLGHSYLLSRMGHRILRGGGSLLGGGVDPLGVYTGLILDPRIEITLVRRGLDAIDNSDAINDFIGNCLDCRIDSSLLQRFCNVNLLYGILKWSYGRILRDYEIRCYVHSWINIISAG